MLQLFMGRVNKPHANNLHFFFFMLQLFMGRVNKLHANVLQYFYFMLLIFFEFMFSVIAAACYS